MDSVSPPVVLVGVSGTQASAEAMRWAATEAWRRGDRLRVVRCWDPDFTAPYAGQSGRLADGAQHAATRLSLADLMGQVFGDEPPNWVTSELRRGVAERILASLSAEAELLVVGSAGQGGPAGQARSIGPVIRGCLSRAQCPVVVVGGEPATDQPQVSQPEPAAAGFRLAGRPRSGAGTKDPGPASRSPLPARPSPDDRRTERTIRRKVPR